MTTPDYPELRRETNRLAGRLREAAPATKEFGRLHQAAVADGALPTATKEMIALAIAVATHCDPCIAFHVHDALRAGASREEIAEAIAVAVSMGGGPAMLYGSRALLAVDQHLGNVPQQG